LKNSHRPVSQVESRGRRVDRGSGSTGRRYLVQSLPNNEEDSLAVWFTDKC